MDRASIQERFGIIGSSPALRNVIDRVRQVAQSDITVLVEGESGVGKELVANLLHALSPRRHGSLVVVNCGAIPEGLIESELFGAEKGAYTGAVERRSGYFEEADGGTIFLDEIGEMPLAAQVRLLRVLESGEFTRVGSSTVRRTDARVVAATNKDLAREVEAGRFREDLYYRLSTVLVRIPPLRERREDILPIFESFLHRFSQKYNSPLKRLDDGARGLLESYRWPGNVRELRNVAEQAVVLLRSDTVTADDLRPYLRGVTARGDGAGLLPVRRGGEGDPSEARERELIYRALLELRLEVRELKEEVGRLVNSAGIAVPRDVIEREDFPGRGDFVIVREADREDFDALIEDVSYEIENEPEVGAEGLRARREAPGPVGPNGNALAPARPPAGPSEPRPARSETDRETRREEEPDELPTLEDAERDLITRALKRFDGNRRQTARALGISERTLYRKLKDIDEAL